VIKLIIIHTAFNPMWYDGRR